MFLIRDVMFCKPGQARPMVQKFQTLSTLLQPMGVPPLRIMTDVSSERFWMVVAEFEVDNLEKYAEMVKQTMGMKEFQEAMKGYHDLIDQGRREIYQIES